MAFGTLMEQAFVSRLQRFSVSLTVDPGFRFAPPWAMVVYPLRGTETVRARLNTVSSDRWFTGRDAGATWDPASLPVIPSDN